MIFGALAGVLLLIVIVNQALQGVEVEVQEVVPGNITRSFTEEGVVTAQNEHTVHSLVRGRVDSLPVAEGEWVEQGDLLITLEDDELRFALAQLDAQLEGLKGEAMQLTTEPGIAEVESLEIGIKQAKRNLNSIKNNYQRIEYLFEQGIATKVELEESENLLKEAQYGLEIQEKALTALYEAHDPPAGSKEIIAAQRKALLTQKDLINHQMKNYRVYAPISGVVTNLNVESKGITGPETPMMIILNQDEYSVETGVLTRDIYDIALGMTVGLTLELRSSDIEFTGEVIEIAPYAEASLSPLGLEEERIRVTIAPNLPEDLKIGPGYKLSIEFITEEQRDKLIVPKSVVFTYGGEDALFVVEGERAVVRKVETGFETRREVVITSGLEEGDLVILDPQADGLSDGGRISYSINQR